MVKSGLSSFRGKRVLLLQGPVGPFFQRLAQDLTQAGAQVFKVNFNGGDWFFYPSNAFQYRGTAQDWPAYLEALLDRLHVDMVMLFGDCRPIHRVAHEIAHGRGLEIGVFEEGYIRPHYITLERYGVNDNSPLSRSPITYLNSSLPPLERPQMLGSTFRYAATWAVLYYFFGGLLKPFFWHYEHHRPLTWLEGLPWLRSFWRKGYYKLKESRISSRIQREFAGRYFLVPLQVHNDFQIKAHSEFVDVEEFINHVMTSFAHHAPKGKLLVFKHHPMDRGYCDYSGFIKKRAEQLGLSARCFYIHDQHLPTLLDHASGVVVVNSTVGLSAILHGAPVKVCGKALYDMKGLTFHHSLNRFWREAQHAKPHAKLMKNFHDHLVMQSQLNGSFYKRLPIVASAAGLNWCLSPESTQENELDVETEVQLRHADGQSSAS